VTRVRWIATGVAVFVLLLGAVFVVTVGRNHDAHGSMLNKPVPALTLDDIATRKPVTTSGLAGKVVIVNFWNSWCIPCQQELPALSAFYNEHRTDVGFELIGVVRDDTTKAVQQYVARENIGWTIASDPGGQAAVAFGTTGQPETYAIAPNGVVVGEEFGPATVSDLDRMLAAAQGS